MVVRGGSESLVKGCPFSSWEDRPFPSRYGCGINRYVFIVILLVFINLSLVFTGGLYQVVSRVLN